MGSFQDYPSSSKDSAGVTRQLFLPAETRPSKHRFSQWGSVIPAANWVEDEDDEVLEAANRHSKSFRERVPEMIRPTGELVRDGIDRVGKQWGQFLKDPPVVAIEGKRGKKVLGPGGAAGMGCGVGIGAGITGGWGLGIGSGNSLRFVMGVGVGCGVGVGYGYGFGFGSKWVASEKGGSKWLKPETGD